MEYAHTVKFDFTYYFVATGLVSNLKIVGLTLALVSMMFY